NPVEEKVGGSLHDLGRRPVRLAVDQRQQREADHDDENRVDDRRAQPGPETDVLELALVHGVHHNQIAARLAGDQREARTSSSTGAELPDGASIPRSAAIVGAMLAGSTSRQRVAGLIPAPAK